MTVLTTLSSFADTYNFLWKTAGLSLRGRGGMFLCKHKCSQISRLLCDCCSRGLQMSGHPLCKITSGSYPSSRSVQCRRTTRNSCAKLASISFTFSPTVNPLPLSFSHCFVPLTARSLPPTPFFFFPLFFWSFVSGCHTVWSERSRNSAC